MTTSKKLLPKPVRKTSKVKPPVVITEERRNVDDEPIKLYADYSEEEKQAIIDSDLGKNHVVFVKKLTLFEVGLLPFLYLEAAVKYVFNYINKLSLIHI